MSQPLWIPSEDTIRNANMTRFMERVNQQTGKSFADYADLYQWSIENIEQFWQLIWDESGVLHSQSFDTVLEERTMPGARWFTGARLNFARNLLRYQDEHTAILAYGEAREPLRLSYNDLFTQVAACAAGLKKLGVGKGDRVAGMLPNAPEAIIAMLAATSLGAIWSSCSPDFGTQGVYDRFGQIEPRILITVSRYRYHGKIFDCKDKVRELLERIPQIEKTVIIDYLSTGVELRPDREMNWSELLKSESDDIEFVDLGAKLE